MSKVSDFVKGLVSVSAKAFNVSEDIILEEMAKEAGCSKEDLITHLEQQYEKELQNDNNLSSG